MSRKIDITPIGMSKRKKQVQMADPPEVEFSSKSEEHDLNEAGSQEIVYVQIKPEVTNTFNISTSSIETLSFLPNGSVMALAEDQTLMKIDPNGQVKIKMDVRGLVMDMCGLTDEEILITHESHKSIYKQNLKSAAETEIVLKTKPLIPADARPTHDKGLAVLAVDRWDFEISPRTRRQLKKFKMDGELVKSVEFDKFNDRLFVQPGRVRVNDVTGDIAVCNYTDHGKDHVLVFDKNLDLKFRTFGDKDVIAGDKRLPKNFKRAVVFNDLVFDDENNMIVVETKSRSVQLLNESGYYQRTLYKDGLEPRSVAMDIEGNIWIGCYTGDIQVVRYSKYPLDTPLNN